ncbi:hypothetical protein TNCV_1904011 [Trichonephila clavipes]|nr:hypothetical protein TNCV_1904011 [Trichonephila clavipes]
MHRHLRVKEDGINRGWADFFRERATSSFLSCCGPPNGVGVVRRREKNLDKKETWTMEDRDWSRKRVETMNAGGVEKPETMNAGGVGEPETMV